MDLETRQAAVIVKLQPGSASVAPEEYFLAPEKLIAGNPKQTVWLHYTDTSKQFFAGCWYSEPGKWRVAYTEEEYCELLEGVSLVTDASGNAVRLTAGDRCVIPRGFEGTWEVIEATRKIFVIYEAGGANT